MLLTYFGLDKIKEKQVKHKIEIHKRMHSWLRCTIFPHTFSRSIFHDPRLLKCANQIVLYLLLICLIITHS